MVSLSHGEYDSVLRAVQDDDGSRLDGWAFGRCVLSFVLIDSADPERLHGEAKVVHQPEGGIRVKCQMELVLREWEVVLA